jgi:hypothetical protein
VREFSASGVDHLARAAAEYQSRAAAGRLPAPVDADHRVGEFKEGRFAPHRYPL